jgi:hypothetical protein
MSMTRLRWMLLACGAVVWCASVSLGFVYLFNYSVEAGTPASAPEQWPMESRIPAPKGAYSLVMTIHPQCPCSRASVIELNNLMALLRRERVTGHVLVVKPADFPDEWIHTESVRAAREIPGVDVVVDIDGKESSRLGAATSGQVLLYGPDGRLRFAGGLTPERGHLGDSAGRQRIVSLVHNGTADGNTSLVFGCELGATICPPRPHRTESGS